MMRLQCSGATEGLMQQAPNDDGAGAGLARRFEVFAFLMPRVHQR
jgi:hypothetical protein